MSSSSSEINNILPPFSQNSNSNNLNSKFEDNCLICGRFTDTLHFQITACRACSAFFRRAVQTKKRYSCQKGNEKCDLFLRVKGKPLCRFCRFKKCVAVGMRIEQAPPIESPALLPSPDNATFYDVPQNLLETEIKFVGKSVIVNWDPTADSVRNILNSKPTFLPKINSSSTAQLSELQRFQIGLSRLINYAKPKNEIHPFKDDAIAKASMIQFYQTYLTVLTQMLTGLNFYMKLSLDNRFSMFKHFWLKFQSLERLFCTCQALGYDINDTRMVFDDKHTFECLKDCFTLASLSPQEEEKFKQLHIPSMQNYVTYVMIPFKQIRVTEIELAYMGLMLLWDIRDVEGLDSQAREYANEIIDRASSEMHNYYTYEMRSPNYASRLMKLSKIVSGIQHQSEERKKIATMAQIFNLFTYDLSDCLIIDH